MRTVRMVMMIITIIISPYSAFRGPKVALQNMRDTI